MTNSFYLKTPKQQKRFQSSLLLVFLIINIAFAWLMFMNGLAFFIFFFATILLTIIAPFFDVPSGIKSGNLKYYSTMLIAEKPRNNSIALHSGSLFDYYFSFNQSDSASIRKRKVLLSCLTGLLSLIEQYEKSQLNNIEVKVTSYILNHRTAQKLGLVKAQQDMLQRLILYFNFFNLTCSLSLINKKLTFANVTKTESFKVDMDTLIGKKEKISALVLRLNKFGENR